VTVPRLLPALWQKAPGIKDVTTALFRLTLPSTFLSQTPVLTRHQHDFLSAVCELADSSAQPAQGSSELTWSFVSTHLRQAGLPTTWVGLRDLLAQ
jgi:hypothetical protein